MKKLSAMCLVVASFTATQAWAGNLTVNGSRELSLAMERQKAGILDALTARRRRNRNE